MQALNFALIGAGRMGQTHARVLAGLSDCQISCVMDARADVSERVAATLGARSTTRLTDVLADASIGAVIITTPTPTHPSVIEAAARAGKAIFVEKPVADRLEAGRDVVRVTEDMGVPCQVGFQRRFDPAYTRAKQMIDAGELGRLEGFRAVGRDPFPPELAYLRTSGGIMLDMGIHDLDLARWLVGEVTEVQAVGGALAVPELQADRLFDTAVALLRFENGAVGTLEVALRTSYGYDIRTEILGEKGRIHVEVDHQPAVTFYDTNGVHHDRPRDFEQRFRQAYRQEIVAFVHGLRLGLPVSPTPRDAWYSLRLAIAAQRALETGEKIQVSSLGEL